MYVCDIMNIYSPVPPCIAKSVLCVKIIWGGADK